MGTQACTMTNKILGLVIVAVVYLLIGSIAVTFDSYVIWPTLDTAAGALSLIGFNVIVVFIYIAHWNCMCSDPGFVPAGWDNELKSDVEDPQQGGRSATHCSKCRQDRPDRAHHCKQCAKCVVNMDHHCPWMNNCVGLHNRKLFIVFLFYAELGCSIVLGGMLQLFFDQLNGDSGSKVVLVIVIYLMDVVLVLAIGGLLIFQLKMVFKNQTTLEVLAQSPASYDRGPMQNFSLVCGPDWWLWLLPWQLGAPLNSPIVSSSENASLVSSSENGTIHSP